MQRMVKDEYDDLFQFTKKCCVHLDEHAFFEGPLYSPYSEKELYEIFKRKNPHQMTNAIIKIAKLLDRHFKSNDALTILDEAQKSPLGKARYHQFCLFGQNKQCLKKIMNCKTQIILKREKEERKREKKERANQVPKHL